MMPNKSIVAVACAVLALSPAGAAAPKGSAKAGDAAWVQCVWSRAPDSAARWLAMKVPAWKSPFKDPSVLLGHRLIALCDERAANPLKPNHEPSWKAIAGALKKGKPRAAAPAAPGPAVGVALCESTIAGEGKPFVYLYEIVRRAGGKETTTFQQHMVQFGDQASKAPQDIRNVPVAGARVERRCREIGPGGELADA
jgi:hypothetical protein